MQQLKKKLNFKEEKNDLNLKTANFMYNYNEKSIQLSGLIRFLLARDIIGPVLKSQTILLMEQVCSHD